MTVRHLIAYALMLMLMAGIAWALWNVTYNSPRSVRRRQRRARQARRQLDNLEERTE
jgi:hypothetical protein